METATPADSSVHALEVVSLGGLGEFGMNMMVIACGGTAIDRKSVV